MTDWTGTLAIEGVETGDGRFIEPGALDWRELPLPLRWTPRDEGGHFGAVVVGRIDDISRDGDKLVGTGVLDGDGEFGAEAVRLMREQMVRGVSVDLDAVEVAEMLAEGEEFDPFAPPTLRVTAGRIAGATLVDLPAFEGASIALTEAEPVLAEVEAAVQYATAAAIDEALAEDGDTFVKYGESYGRLLERIDEENARVQPLAQGEDGEWSDDGDPAEVALADLAIIDELPGAEEDEPADDAAPADGPALFPVPASAMTAAAVALLPPAAWFDDPAFVAPQAMTVDADGRVFGHLALWGTCHTGRGSECLQPPESATGYAYFRTGELVTAEGTVLAVGQITMDAGHAPLGASAAATARHYDDTATAVADIVVGDDAWGVWIAGALRPSVSDDQLRALRASSLSGDWRRIGGSLELVAALAVNSPGFPVPRAALSADRVLALTASSGVVTEERTYARAVVSLTPIVEHLARGLRRDEESRVADLSARVGDTPRTLAVLALAGRLATT